jgi:hypothetical protein
MELSREIAIAKAITRKPRQHTSFDGGEAWQVNSSQASLFTEIGGCIERSKARGEGLLDGTGSNSLYAIDLAGDLQREQLSIGAKGFSFLIWKFPQKIRIRGNVATPKHRESCAISQPATHVNQTGQVPGISLLPWGMMIGDDVLEVGG